MVFAFGRGRSGVNHRLDLSAVKSTTEKQAASELPKNEKVETRNDDLTRIEGIGPKVAGVLKNTGITSFISLAHADPAEVKNVLNEAGPQMMNPEGWIEQAEFAAKAAG